jgi:GTP-binding protein EngB required for normal cell division
MLRLEEVAQLLCRLRRVFVLVDARLGIQNIDLEMCELLHQNSVPHQVS